MGKSVKHLIDHPRDRQKTHGMNAFNFKFTLNGNSMQPASYPAAATEAIAAGFNVVQWPVANDVAPAVVNDVFMDSHSDQGAGSPCHNEDPQAALGPVEHEVRFELLVLLMIVLKARYRDTLHCRQVDRSVGFSWTILAMHAMCSTPPPLSLDIVLTLNIPSIPTSPLRSQCHHQAKSHCLSFSHLCQMYRWHPIVAYLMCRGNSLHHHGLHIRMLASHCVSHLSITIFNLECPSIRWTHRSQCT
jgi:hypothetical protein